MSDRFNPFGCGDQASIVRHFFIMALLMRAPHYGCEVAGRFFARKSKKVLGDIPPAARGRMGFEEGLGSKA